MSQNTESEDASESEQDYPELAIEGELPLKAVGIENLKEANPKHMPPHRYIHPWFARRPTPAARLSVLGSVMPEGTTPDEILSLMQIGPDNMEAGIAEYVEEKKATESQRDGTLGEWYGYPRPFTQSPSSDELDSLHDDLRDTWNGELPTVLDATAGGGVIPFESIRYGLPTIANELNPVPSIIIKILLEYAPTVGSLGEEFNYWSEKVISEATDNLDEFYPTERNGRDILASACTYLINCDSCSGEVPTVPKWWIQKKNASEGYAIRPEYVDGKVEYECIKLTGGDNELDFDPSDGTVSRGDVECPHCGVVTQNEEIKKKLRDGEFEYEIYAVKYNDSRAGSGYRAGRESDNEAIDEAREYIESNFDLMTFLATPIPSGFTTDQPRAHGITEWRDVYNPRQLVSHYEYLRAFQSYKDEIREEYDEQTANAILTLLTIASSKMANRNSRLSSWDTGKGYPDHIFKSSDYGFCRIFTDNNPNTEGMGYQSHARKIINSYEEVVDMVSSGVTATTFCGDAATLTDELGSESVQAAVVDPPYYDTIPYAEFSDVFYTLQKEYLRDVHPNLFNTELTNKSDEAIANPSKFDGMEGDKSKSELAKRDYERKMQEIFSELYDVLEPGGVLTIMFTHKKADAWDTLATSLIEAGFTITATHPITSEIPKRASVQNKNSADSTILLSGRKPLTQKPADGQTLWNDVKEKTRIAATETANNLHDSGLSLTKTDTIISTFGPTLRVYADNYPVVNKKGEKVPPRKALTEARTAAVEVLVDRYLNTEDFNKLDALTRWYVLAWLTYDSDVFPYDEGYQLGLGVGVDIDKVKRETKIWGKRSGDIQLKGHSGRVQDIVRLEAGEDVSQRKYPVDPTKKRFSHAIDVVQSAIHVYENKGADAAWDWLTERNLKNNQRFETTVKALLEVFPANDDTADTLLDMVSGKTGDYLDIDISTLNLNVEQDEEGPEQTGINEFE